MCFRKKISDDSGILSNVLTDRFWLCVVCISAQDIVYGTGTVWEKYDDNTADILTDFHT